MASSQRKKYPFLTAGYLLRSPQALVLVGIVLVLCLAPLLFLGPDPLIAFPRVPWMDSPDIPVLQAEKYQFIGGPFTHTLLLLLGGTIAGCAAILAFARSATRPSALTAVISMVLFWTAVISIIQAISAEGISTFTEDPADFIPFTWFVTRTFDALLLTIGGALLLLPNPTRLLLRTRYITSIFLIFGLLAAAVLWLSSNIPLPQTVYPDNLITRPWDIPIFLLLFLCAVFIYPRVHREKKSHFSFALWLSLIPLVAAQLYLIFGSAFRFDDAFNTAYGLHIVFSGIIFAGLIWDYVRSNREEERLIDEVRAREARIRTMFNTASEAIIAVDEEGRIELWNPYATTIFGWTRDEALGQSATDLLAPASQRQRLIEHVDGMTTENGHSRFTPGNYPPLELTIETRSGESRVVQFSIAASGPQRHPAYTIFARDMTERKALEQNMVQMDRVITIGTLTAGIGHEINNPLAYLLTNLELARETICDEPVDTDELTHQISASLNGAERIHTIVQDLRLMSGFQEEPPHLIDVAEVLRAALRMTERHLKAMTTLTTDINDDVFALADESRLTQVVINLLNNAAHAMPQRPHEENHVHLCLRSDGDHILIEVSDNGTGIPEELQEKIFDPFFTTKPRGQGTGLGLSLSRKIIASFNGELTLTSKPFEGSTFQIRLPRLP